MSGKDMGAAALRVFDAYDKANRSRRLRLTAKGDGSVAVWADRDGSGFGFVMDLSAADCDAMRRFLFSL